MCIRDSREVEWSVTHKMRLPHKVGMPLGSGGSGDDASGGAP